MTEKKKNELKEQMMMMMMMRIHTHSQPHRKIVARWKSAWGKSARNSEARIEMKTGANLCIINYSKQ